MSVFELVSLVLNVLLGGGLLTAIVTLKAQKNKANAEAKGAEANAESTELDNVDKAVKIWRDLAETMEQRNAQMQKNYDNILSEVQLLRSEVKKQNQTINKILKILDSIDHDNMEQKVKEAKEIAG